MERTIGPGVSAAHLHALRPVQDWPTPSDDKFRPPRTRPFSTPPEVRRSSRSLSPSRSLHRWWLREMFHVDVSSRPLLSSGGSSARLLPEELDEDDDDDDRSLASLQSRRHHAAVGASLSCCLFIRIAKSRNLPTLKRSVWRAGLKVALI